MAFFVFCAFFLIAVSAATSAEDHVRIPKIDEHNIIKCETVDQDKWKLLDSETVSVSGKFLQIIERTITYPSTGVGKEIITCVRVIDMLENGHGGYPEIQSGGVSFHDVTIRLVSQRSKGFKFQIEIWGKIEDGFVTLPTSDVTDATSPYSTQNIL